MGTLSTEYIYLLLYFSSFLFCSSVSFSFFLFFSPSDHTTQKKKQRRFLVAVSIAELGPAEAARAHGISTRMACYYHKTAIKEISTGMTITHGGKG